MAASQSRTVLSWLAEAMVSPDGLNATQSTDLSWPVSVSLDLPAVGVPDPDGAIGVARGDPSTVGAEGHARSPRLHSSRTDVLLRTRGSDGWLGVPDLHHPVEAARGERFAVGTERIPSRRGQRAP